MKKYLMIAVCVLAAALPGCGGTVTGKDLKTGLGIANLVCDLLPEEKPDLAEFACDAVDVGGKITDHFVAKVPKGQSPEFAAKYARKK